MLFLGTSACIEPIVPKLDGQFGIVVGDERPRALQDHRHVYRIGETNGGEISCACLVSNSTFIEMETGDFVEGDEEAVARRPEFYRNLRRICSEAVNALPSPHLLVIDSSALDGRDEAYEERELCIDDIEGNQHMFHADEWQEPTIRFSLKKRR